MAEADEGLREQGGADAALRSGVTGEKARRSRQAQESDRGRQGAEAGRRQSQSCLVDEVLKNAPGGGGVSSRE
jgi:hypothetical protein